MTKIILITLLFPLALYSQNQKSKPTCFVPEDNVEEQALQVIKLAKGQEVVVCGLKKKDMYHDVTLTVLNDNKYGDETRVTTADVGVKLSLQNELVVADIKLESAGTWYNLLQASYTCDLKFCRLTKEMCKVETIKLDKAEVAEFKKVVNAKGYVKVSGELADKAVKLAIGGEKDALTFIEQYKVPSAYDSAQEKYLGVVAKLFDKLKALKCIK